jgi:hypothetical protein
MQPPPTTTTRMAEDAWEILDELKASIRKRSNLVLAETDLTYGSDGNRGNLFAALLEKSQMKTGLIALLLLDVLLIVVVNIAENVLLRERISDLGNQLCAANAGGNCNDDYAMRSNHNRSANSCYPAAGSCGGGYNSTQYVEADLPDAIFFIGVVECCILSIFVLEHVFIMLALGKAYFKCNQVQAMTLLDLLACVSSFVVEAFILTGGAPQTPGVFILFRLVRFLRVGNHNMFNPQVGRLAGDIRRARVDVEFHRMAIETLKRSIANDVAFDFQATVPHPSECDNFEAGANSNDVLSTNEKGVFSAIESVGASQLPREFPRGQLAIGKTLGAGQFGSVATASFTDEELDLAYPVAVKQVTSDAPINAQMELLLEASTMARLKHPNVVRINGVVTIGTPKLIILEIATLGSLSDYLLKPEAITLKPHMKEHMASNVVGGMQYIASKRLIHRDLAARNVLLSSDLSCKIADFGLSVQLRTGEDQYIDNRSDLAVPVRWVPPEVFSGRTFSEKSDVWSFGT